MQVLEWYVGFLPPALAPLRMIAGHVEMWGYTADETWVFLDFHSLRGEVLITHRHDEVERLLTERNERCPEVWRYSPERDLRFPLFPPMNCVTVCAHVLGLRAWSPAGLRRTLRRNGAVELKHGWSEQAEAEQGIEAAGTSVFSRAPGVCGRNG